MNHAKLISRFEPMDRHLVLTIHASLNLIILNECDYLSLDFLDAPTKCQCHTIETDSLEWLEVEYDGCMLHVLRDVVYVDAQVYVYVMSCLSKRHDMSVEIGE